MFKTRCGKAVELLGFQNRLKMYRDSKEKQGMYLEEKAIMGYI